MNNATIEIVPYASSGDVEAGIRYNAQQDEYKAMPFTIKLVGENKIVNEVSDEGANDRQEKYGILTFDCMTKTMITGTGSLDISMEATPGQTSDGKAYQYWGICMRKHTVIDGTAININITGDEVQARGFEMHYTNTLSLENGAKLAISTGGHEASYGMWAERTGKLYSVDESSVLEVASGNLAYKSIYITDDTAKLSALVNTEPAADGAEIWDGETDLNSEEAGYKYIRIPGDHECADYIDPATVQYSWSGTSKVTASGICKVCGKEETETVTTTSKVTKQPTSTVEGVKTYTATFTKVGFTTQTKTESIGTAVVPGASAEATDLVITSAAGNADPAGSQFAPLMLKSAKQTKSSVKLSWKKVGGATKYVVYGNKRGSAMRQIATVTGASLTAKNVAGAKLKKGTYYKFIVVALDSNNSVVSTSKIAHVATKGGKVTNPKKVTAKKGKKAVKKVALKAGKSVKLKASASKASKKLKLKKCRKVSFESSNPAIATVTAAGKVKAKAKGTCYVYAYAQNGAFKKVKVTVK